MRKNCENEQLFGVLLLFIGIPTKMILFQLHKTYYYKRAFYNKKISIKFFFFALYFLIGLCHNFAEPYISTIDSGVPTVSPKFLTRGHLYKGVVGDTVILPCKVQDLGE